MRLPNILALSKGTALLLAVAAGLFIQHASPQGSDGRPTGTSISLARPALAESGTFPEWASGIAAYANVGKIAFQTLNDAAVGSTKSGVGRVKGTDGTGYVWVEVDIRGRVGEASWSDSIQVYADTNGWVVSFLTRGQEIGTLVQWAGGDPQVSDANPLEQGMQKILAPMGKNFGSIRNSIGYYDFEHPKATTAWIAAKYGDGSLSLVVPSNLVIAGAGVNLISSRRAPGSCCGTHTQFQLAPDILSRSMLSERRLAPASLAQNIPYSLILSSQGVSHGHVSAAAIVVVTQPR